MISALLVPSLRLIPLRYLTLILLLWSLLGGPDGHLLSAQTVEDVQEARQLVQEGHFDQAAERLAGYLAAYPEDGSTWWFQAQLLGRAGEIEAALVSYSRAISLLPGDAWVRLEYGRLLIIGGRWREVPVIVDPVPTLAGVSTQAAAQAHDLLASIHEWRGDRTLALDHAERAVRLDPDQPDFRKHVEEIQREIRSWGTVDLKALDDDQPFRRSGVHASGGVYLTPNLAAVVDASALFVEGDGVGTGFDGALGLRGVVGGSGFEFALWAGGVGQDGVTGAQSSWKGAAELAVRLPRETRAWLGVSRDRYRWTIASANTLVMQNRVELGVARKGSRGWVWEAAVLQERHQDGNAIRTGYAWALAPVARQLRLGYALAYQDSDETRWTSLGVYDPYYTPEQLISNSVLVELTDQIGGLDARLSVNYAFWARELVPDPVGASDPPLGPSEQSFQERTSHPFTGKARISLPTTSSFSWAVEMEYRRNTFFEFYSVGISTTYKWGGR